jgi:DNA mismatch endonuclease, patch repair protein
MRDTSRWVPFIEDQKRLTRSSDMATPDRRQYCLRLTQPNLSARERRGLVDTLSKADRSRLMRQVRRIDTRPEMRLRRLLHSMGRRFRVHKVDLPGTPDVVLPRSKVAIFVHGCFWHRHPGCKKATTPAENARFWQEKFADNRSRDRRKARLLRRLGWKVLVVWECETANLETLTRRLARLLPPQR